MQQRATEEMEAQGVSASGLLENYQLNLSDFALFDQPEWERGTGQLVAVYEEHHFK